MMCLGVVQILLHYRSEEKAGTISLVRATGIARNIPFTAQIITGLLSAVALVAAGTVGATVSAFALADDNDAVMAASTSYGSHLGVLLLTAGLTAATIAIVPRLSGLSWFMPIYGILVVILAQILQAPDWIAEWGPFNQYLLPDSVADDWWKPAIFTAVGLVLMALGCWRVTNRDIADRLRLLA